MHLPELMEQFKGKTPDQIAAIVKARKIKGRTGTTYLCPFALLLNGENTGQHIIGRRYIVRRSGTKLEQFHTPRNVMAFIRKFDIGGYPELMAPAKRCLPQPKRPGQTDYHKPNRKRAPRAVKNHISKLVGRFG